VRTGKHDRAVDLRSLLVLSGVFDGNGSLYVSKKRDPLGEQIRRLEMKQDKTILVSRKHPVIVKQDNIISYRSNETAC